MEEHTLISLRISYRFSWWRSSLRAGNADFSARWSSRTLFSRVQEILDERFPDRWIDRDGPIVWPARSSDLNIFDYFVWGCQSCIRDDIQNEICNEIIATFQTIIPDMAQHSKFLGESNFACKCKESTSSSCYIRSVRIEWIKPTEENHFKKNVSSYLPQGGVKIPICVTKFGKCTPKVDVKITSYKFTKCIKQNELLIVSTILIFCSYRIVLCLLQIRDWSSIVCLWKYVTLRKKN